MEEKNKINKFPSNIIASCEDGRKRTKGGLNKVRARTVVQFTTICKHCKKRGKIIVITGTKKKMTYCSRCDVEEHQKKSVLHTAKL